MTDNLVTQLYQTLVDAIKRTRPAAMHKPVTVAEIYQDLVPYKTARSTLGFDLNADYEHTLLRLLAGEGDLARIEPREVRDKLRLELESPNPDVGLFRNYAACDVWVNVGADESDVEYEFEAEDSWEDDLLRDTPALASTDEIQAALGVADSNPDPELEDVPRARPVARFEMAPDEPPEHTAPPQSRPAQAHQLEAGPCAYCGVELPAGRMVNFCPFCGSDQSQQPCPSCGEMLEPLWRFCIACGVRVHQLGDHVN